MTHSLSTEVVSVDCATGALYYLARIKGINIDTNTLASLLPILPPDGHSFATIRSVASKLGIELSGVKLSKDRTPFEKAMIVHILRGPRGHFMVLRPIDSEGLVQLIDSNGFSMILNYRHLELLPGWTGMALVDQEGTSHLNAILCAHAIGLGIALLACLIRRHWHNGVSAIAF
jgi:ABC-type bacteriocin/lantibiotic exporter with double-glycine peptidase domain